jgi:hypothetical protein
MILLASANDPVEPVGPIGAGFRDSRTLTKFASLGT